MSTPLDAIREFGVVRLAKALQVTPGAISQWRQIPPGRVLAVEAATGIPRDLLRPDLYAAGRAPRRKRSIASDPAAPEPSIPTTAEATP